VPLYFLSLQNTCQEAQVSAADTGFAIIFRICGNMRAKQDSRQADDCVLRLGNLYPFG
jgi:hypothetical protein